jgi:hypothetical protein
LNSIGGKSDRFEISLDCLQNKISVSMILKASNLNCCKVSSKDFVVDVTFMVYFTDLTRDASLALQFPVKT